MEIRQAYKVLFAPTVIRAIAHRPSEFPRKPIGWLKRNITDEADARLAFYLPLPADQPVPPEAPEAPPRPQLPEGVVDAPLVRVFNFLRAWPSYNASLLCSRATEMMSMSYMLEILCYQVSQSCVVGCTLSADDAPGRATACFRLG